MSQREKNLYKQAERTHTKWMMDTCDRYEKAGLWPPDAGATMSLVLMEALASVWAAGADNPEIEEKLFSVLRRMLEARKKLARRVREEVNGH